MYIPHPIRKWLARPLSCFLSPGYKNRPRTHIWGAGSPWLSGICLATGSYTLSPTALINFILLSFCTMSGNSFPTHAWIMTFTLLKKKKTVIYPYWTFFACRWYSKLQRFGQGGGWFCWAFVAHWISVAYARSFLAAQGLQSVWAQLLQGTGFRALGLSCPSACGILVPHPWMEPTSPALEDVFLTTGPPGKSQVKFLFKSLFCKLSILPKQEGNS